MRQNRFASAALFPAAAIMASALLAQQPDAGLSIGNYQIVSEQRYTRTQSYITYRADLLNTGIARTAITATATSLLPDIKIVPGRGALHFAPVPENSRVTSSDTFTILVDRSVADVSQQLRWSFLNPVASAGPNQTVTSGATVHLNGSASSNPTGVGTLSYLWSFESRPDGSQAVLQNGSSPVLASFVVDVPGEYLISLLVRNGTGQDTAVVKITTGNSPPLAKAGANQSIPLGAEAFMNGGGSSDVDGDSLTYFWTMVSQPAGSKAVILGFRGVVSSLIADVAGKYVVQLVVNDGKIDSAPSLVTITAGGVANTPPVANAGINQTVTTGSAVQLIGSGSTDIDGDPLTYKWSLISLPENSAAKLTSTAAVNPIFTADVAGTYIAQLIVNDGQADSSPATVVVTTNSNQSGAPTANAGPNQTVVHGATVTLNGSGSDPNNLPLTYKWFLIAAPAGSNALLSNPSVQSPLFVADKPGNYVAQLIVNNGTLSSVPSTVTITTTNTAPMANPGPPQTVPAGFLAVLNGGTSSDADNDPLSYSWSFTSRPDGSSAALSAASSKTPTFTPDVQGSYIVQLIVNDGFTNSAPVTVTITAIGTKIILSPDPFTLLHTPGTLKVAVNPPAGSAGVKITFFGFDPAVVSLPASIVIPPDQSSVDLTVTPLKPGSTYIYGTAQGYQAGVVPVNVTAPVISVNLAAAGVGLGRSISGAVQLSAPAPTGGTAVTLVSSPAGLVSFTPPAVTIAAGQTTGVFSVTGSAAGVVTGISGVAPGYESGAAATLVVASNLGAIMITPPQASVVAESSVAIDVNLSTPAPSGGVLIQLVSGDTTTAQVTAEVFIPKGAMAPATPAIVSGIAAGVTTIKATAQAYTEAVQTITVTPKPVAQTTFGPGRRNAHSGD